MISLGYAASAGVAIAQTAATGSGQAFPTRTIRAIVPYAPGGSTDVVMRILAPRMSEMLGQQVIVENRPGGSSTIGLDIAAKAQPDGHTIGIANVTFCANPSLIRKMPFDSEKDLAPVSFMSLVTLVLSVHPSVPAKSVKDLIALAKAQPGVMNYASAGNVSANHLATERFSSATGIKMTHVPYKGGGPAVTDLVAGQVQVMFSGTPQMSAMVKAGRLRVIATATPKPNRVAPEQPAIADLFPGFDCNTWYGLLAPAGTPLAVVARFNAELNRALADPGVIQRLLDQGVEATPGSPAVFRQLIVAETERWRKVIKAAGITAESAQ